MLHRSKSHRPSDDDEENPPNVLLARDKSVGSWDDHICPVRACRLHLTLHLMVVMMMVMVVMMMMVIVVMMMVINDI